MMRNLLVIFLSGSFKRKAIFRNGRQWYACFDIGKAAFSICPEVENGYIKVSLLLMMRYGWEQMEAVLE